MSKIEIEIPDNQEIDWEASAKKNQIVFKNKNLTYTDICEELFKYGHYFISDCEVHETKLPAYDSNAASTKHQLDVILAKNKLANVARYLNGECEFDKMSKYIIWYNCIYDEYVVKRTTQYPEYSNVIFKSAELARQAISILGIDTIKLALEPMY